MLKPTQYNTSLAQFTYTVAREAPISLRRFLPEKLYRAISDEKKAMKFASKSSLEEKREFFAYLGIQSFLIFADMKQGNVNDFRQLFKQFDPVEEKAASSIKKLGDSNIYVSSSKEFCYQLSYLAQLIDTAAYARSMELMRTSYHVKGLDNKLNSPEHKEALDEKETATALVRYMYGVLWATDMCQEVTGVDAATIRVLMYFYLNRQIYLTKEKIIASFAGSMSNRQVTLSVRTLLNSMQIQKHSVAANKSYTITGRGILVVNQFRDKVIKSFDF